MSPGRSTRRVALVAGATGLVGREIVRLLASDASVTEVRALVRRPIAGESGKVRAVVADFENLGARAGELHVDEVFCALGTTIRKAGSRAAFRKVDLDYPLALARLALAGGATRFLLVSALGADSRSRVFYNRVKGELEEALRALGYSALTIARPAVLLGERPEFRPAERIGQWLGRILPARYRSVPAAAVAAALVRAAGTEAAGVRIIENTELLAAG